jgi:hypothetical protein
MIKSMYKSMKLVSLLLSMIVLLQCCKVYYKEQQTLESVIGPEKKLVKVILNDDRKLIFDSLYYKNDDLYGSMKLKDKANKNVEVILHPENIKEIYLLNKDASSIRSVFLGLGIFLVVFGSLLWYGLSQSISINL